MSAPGYETITQLVQVTTGRTLDVTYTGRRLPPPEPVAQTPAQPARRTTVQTAILRLSIRPWANVTLDGTGRGRNSRFIDTIVAGTHRLTFERPGFRTKDTTVTLRAGETRQLNIRMERNQ